MFYNIHNRFLEIPMVWIKLQKRCTNLTSVVCKIYLNFTVIFNIFPNFRLNVGKRTFHFKISSGIPSGMGEGSKMSLFKLFPFFCTLYVAQNKPTQRGRSFFIPLFALVRFVELTVLYKATDDKSMIA